MRHQRKTFHLQMLLALKKIKEHPSQFIYTILFHRIISLKRKFIRKVSIKLFNRHTLLLQNEKYVPYVIEPSLGADRVVLAFLCAAYDEEEIGEGDMRTVLHFHLRKDFPICPIPKGIFLRDVLCTFLKLTKIPCAVAGLKYMTILRKNYASILKERPISNSCSRSAGASCGVSRTGRTE